MVSSNFHNIVVRMPNWLGDCVMATPILKDLRDHFPEANITAMCQKNVADLLQVDPSINTLFSYKRPNGWIHRSCHFDIIEPLRREKFDLGILLTNSFSSAWWFWRSQVKERIGFRGNLRSWLLTQPVDLPKNLEKQHLVTTYKELLKSLNIPLSNSAPRLFISPEEIAYIKTRLIQDGWDPSTQHLIGINPGAAYGTAKCWLPERFAELTEQLLKDKNVFIVFFGDSTAISLNHSICQRFSERVLNLAGKTMLRELMAYISLCKVFLTNDSGPMHIAAALKTPLVALFGSTSDIKTGPAGEGIKKIIHKHVECSPCYKRVCPIDFRCMKRIETEEVLQAVRSLYLSP